VNASRVVLQGGPLHGEEYTVADSLHTVELPTRRLSIGKILFGPPVDTTLYHRDPHRPSVFTHLG
jgi:hypothetical protein